MASIAFFPEGGDTLYVSTESGEYAYSLDEDGTYQFSGPLGITTLEISDGRSLKKMYDDITDEGLQPVLNDYLYV